MFARTERLLLRPGWSQDAEALYAAIRDEGIVRNLARAPWPYTMADAKAFLATERKASAPVSLIFLRTDGAPQLIGTIGLDRDADGETELGYWIARAHWGQGYVTEAGRALIGMARDSLRLKRLTAGHFADNPASGRVLEKLGFRPTGVTRPCYSAGRGTSAPCRRYALALAAEAEAESEVVEKMAA